MNYDIGDKKLTDLLDNTQINLYKDRTCIPENHWLSMKDNLYKFYEWNTFFRRNINRYAEMYYGFSLYPYQHLELLEMNNNDTNIIIGSRAVAKSYIVAIFGCCKASLYPKSKLVIASATKGQSKLIVSEKIKNELMEQSPNLRREIKDIKDSVNDVKVIFKNGSTITVVPASDNARGRMLPSIVKIAQVNYRLSERKIERGLTASIENECITLICNA